MIEGDDLIHSIETWTRHPLAIDNDRLLGALVSLRLECSAVFTFMVPRSNHGDTTQTSGLGPLLSILNRRIDLWETTWSRPVGGQRPVEESCHDFLIQFYGCHLRLQLFSLQLHNAILPNNLDSLWLAYTSALRMLQLVPCHSNHLAFVQDSVHIMIAYSAGFLSKVGIERPRREAPAPAY